MGRISLFYAKCTFYVPSYHPILFNELKNRVSDSFKLYDVALFDLNSINKIISSSDLVILDHSILTAANTNPITINLSIFNYNKDKKFYKEVWEQILYCNKRMVYIASFLDLFAIKSTRAHDGLGKYYKEILERVEAIAWGFSQGLSDNIQNPYLGKEKFTVYSDLNEYEATWHEIVDKIKCTIDLPHCIAKSEISGFKNLNFYNISIPGISYLTREIAYESSIHEGVSIAPYSRLRNYITYIDTLSGKLPNKHITYSSRQLMWRGLQNYILHCSTSSFVCGSSYRYFVRKFLEIPAKNNLMITYPCVGLSHYGFNDGINSIYSYPEDVGKTVKEVINKKTLIKELTTNAKKTLLNLHTAEKRADQFLSTLNSLLKSSIKSGKFQDGEYVIN